MTEAPMYQVLLFYKYLHIDNPDELTERVRKLSREYRLMGRVIVAHEGINATLEGTLGDTEEFVEEFMEDPRFADIQVKRSRSKGKSFPKLSVKVREEIVATGLNPNEADPTVRTAPRLSPEALRAWYEEQKEFIVVDMRNDYEYVSGHFRDAIDLKIAASRELPEALEKIEPLKEKTILTVCTGGVRCEKMSAYLLSRGFKDVYQLEGGIHSYMEKYPGKDFLGTLYTFDQRLTMDFGGAREVIGTCHRCGVSTEDYVNCANLSCHVHILLCRDCIYRDGAPYCRNACREYNVKKAAEERVG
jgi:UPF0176 protein